MRTIRISLYSGPRHVAIAIFYHFIKVKATDISILNFGSAHTYKHKHTLNMN